MKDLIKLTQQTLNDEIVNTVNARELHEFLGSKQQFSDWIKKRLEKYDFIENIDYICVSENYETQRTTGQKGISVRKEYYVTVDTAKELSMIENNEKGREARRYFIKCEKQLLAIDPETKILSKLLKSKSNLETTLILKEYKEVVQAPLLEKVAQQQPKVDFFDTVTASEKLIDIGESSKVLLFEGLGRNNLFKVLRELDKNNVPYQRYVSRGYFKLIETTINGKPYIKTAVYQKGLDFLNKTLANAGYEKLPR